MESESCVLKMKPKFLIPKVLGKQRRGMKQICVWVLGDQVSMCVCRSGSSLNPGCGRSGQEGGGAAAERDSSKRERPKWPTGAGRGLLLEVILDVSWNARPRYSPWEALAGGVHFICGGVPR